MKRQKCKAGPVVGRDQPSWWNELKLYMQVNRERINHIDLLSNNLRTMKLLSAGAKKSLENELHILGQRAAPTHIHHVFFSLFLNESNLDFVSWICSECEIAEQIRVCVRECAREQVHGVMLTTKKKKKSRSQRTPTFLAPGADVTILSQTKQNKKNAISLFSVQICVSTAQFPPAT